MITAVQEAYIERQAYIPEHVPGYVTAISRTEPFLFGDFVAYAASDLLIFVGYPLREGFEEKRLGKALDEAVKRLTPERVSFIAPSIPPSLQECLLPLLTPTIALTFHPSSFLRN